MKKVENNALDEIIEDVDVLYLVIEMMIKSSIKHGDGNLEILDTISQSVDEIVGKLDDYQKKLL